MTLDPRELRNALGRFATGVTVVTTVTGQEEALGLTVNSFSSVSLDPPLVLWSLQNSSEVYRHFSTPRRYAINVLASEHEPLSNLYAQKGEHRLDPQHYRVGRTGVPVLHDALVCFECELETTYPGGDHIIILGRVSEMHGRTDGEPLLFFGGAYRALR